MFAGPVHFGSETGTVSTYWYFECLDHDPPIQSGPEFTQHTDDRHYFRAIELLMTRPVEAVNDYWTATGDDDHKVDRYFEMNATGFLSEHPKCRIGFVNEYGERRTVQAAPVMGAERRTEK